MSIKNQHGIEITLNAFYELMDTEIRVSELAHDTDASCDQEYFDRYCELHAEKFGAEFELSKSNPIY